MKKALIVVAVAACTSPDPGTPLSRLKSSQIEIMAHGDVGVVLHVDNSDGSCTLLGDDVVARLDGQNMTVFRGGYDTDTTGCYPIGFSVSANQLGAVKGIERTTNGAALQIADHSDVWNVEAGKLMSEDFTDDPTTGTLVWTDVTQIATAHLSPSVPIEISGNVIHYPQGTALTWVTATAHPVATRCDGPGQCIVNMTGDRPLGPVNP